jgi:hypothetical protein
VKNKEIIARAAVRAGVLTADQAEEMVERDEDIPFHTLQGWKLRGKYKLKKEEKGTEVKIWRKKEDGSGFYLAKAYLYSKDQVEKE